MLLMLTLVLGIFTFSGFAGTGRSVIDQKATQTEVGIRATRKVGGRVISFGDALVLFKSDKASCFQASWKMALLSFDNLMRVKLTRISLQVHFQPLAFYCCLPRMIPQSSDEEEQFSA